LNIEDLQELIDCLLEPTVSSTSACLSIPRIFLVKTLLLALRLRQPTFVDLHNLWQLIARMYERCLQRSRPRTLRARGDLYAAPEIAANTTAAHITRAR
jgi:hypothetical protein